MPPPCSDMMYHMTHRFSQTDHSVEWYDIGMFELCHKHCLLQELNPVQIWKCLTIQTLQGHIDLQPAPFPCGLFHRTKLTWTKVPYTLQGCSPDTFNANVLQLVVENVFLVGWSLVRVKSRINVLILILLGSNAGLNAWADNQTSTVELPINLKNLRIFPQ